MRIGFFSVADGYPGELARDTTQLYSELLEQAELADQLGFDSFWVAEHHFHPYGMIPRAAAFLAAAAERTKRIRLGAAVVVLPFDNPIRTAEDYAMVDVLSNGRLSVGVGSGYLKHEFDGFNVSFEEKRDRFNESLQVLLRAWSGERFSFDGRFHKLEDVAINVVPIQKPQPPLAVAILNSAGAEHVGASGHDLLLMPYASVDHGSELRTICDAYHRGAKTLDKEHRLYFSLHTHCAESIEQADRTVKPCLDRYIRTRLYAKNRPYETLRQSDLLAVGDPNFLSEILARYAEMGLTDFLAMQNFGGMPHAQVCESMQLMAKHLLRHRELHT